MNTNLFVYGTLLYPEVIYALTGKKFSMTDATIEGYQRLGIKYKPYPAIIPSKGSRVQGKILMDVDTASLAIIDFYEDTEYYRKEIIIQNMPVQVYIYCGKTSRLKKSDWEADTFYKNKFEFYLNNVIPKVLIDYKKIKI